ncbi:MAG: hypothetical protein V4702_00920 [Patescibacteria group bacterium]
MNTFKSPNMLLIQRSFATAACSLIALAGCGNDGNFNTTDRFAKCDTEEVYDHVPVKLGQEFNDDNPDIETIKDRIRTSPEYLIQIAGQLHPEGKGKHSLLNNMRDTAHNKESAENRTHGDPVNNAGDVVCETLPLGSNDPDKDYQIYYDQDGLTLLARVNSMLSKEQAAEQTP